MLEIRQNCELCDKDLAPQAEDAMICSYECTFCVACVAGVLRNVCPNCGGGFVARPIRPSTERREGVSLRQHPPNGTRVLTRWTREEIEAFAAEHAHVPPARR
ncbi:MAG: DUF1272 domain-containing protein [Alphaproteobacteria bacterium]|nr:DUF1272 domain-containing protein [Alphaproteobacteria bacterium]